jgi:hypothetical protein
MPLWIDPTNLPPETAAQFNRAEGTLSVEVTIELDERLRFYFGRRAPDMPAAYAVADGTSLVGMERMAIEGSWSPLGLQIRVTDRESSTACRASQLAVDERQDHDTEHGSAHQAETSQLGTRATRSRFERDKDR